MSAPAAPLEKAVAEARKALADYDGCKGYEADEYAMCCIEPFRLLLAALDAVNCVPGVICPTCLRLEKAEAVLRESAIEPCEEDGFGGPRTCGEECHTCIARRYFAEKGER